MKQIKKNVLDNGFVKLIEVWGGGENQFLSEDVEYEAGIIEAARQSTQGSFRGWEDESGQPLDSKLLKFMYNHNHATPFEFAGMVLEVQAPIFIFREWHRHRTFGYNEMSARYAPLPDVNYIPTKERLFMGSDKNKQASRLAGTVDLTDAYADDWLKQLADFYDMAEALYQEALSNGIPKELARIVLPVGRYSKMRVTGNLRNFLAFNILRSDVNPDAQWEIRQYGNVVDEIIKEVFPRTHKLFEAKFK